MKAIDKLKASLPGQQVKKVFRFPKYAVTSDAEIYDISGDAPLLIKQHRAKTGYYVVWMRQAQKAPKMVPVHKVVAQSFLGAKPSKKHLIRHVDGDCHNNTLGNLAWGTVKENAADRIKHNADRTKLTDKEVRLIRKRLKRGDDPEDLAREMGLSFMTVNGILHKRTYKGVK
jgi:hypothetical protein